MNVEDGMFIGGGVGLLIVVILIGRRIIQDLRRSREP